MTSSALSGSFASASVKKSTHDRGFAILIAIKKKPHWWFINNLIPTRCLFFLYQMMISFWNKMYIYGCSLQLDIDYINNKLSQGQEPSRLLSQWGPFLGSPRLRAPSCFAAIFWTHFHQSSLEWLYLLHKIMFCFKNMILIMFCNYYFW